MRCASSPRSFRTVKCVACRAIVIVRPSVGPSSSGGVTEIGISLFFARTPSVAPGANVTALPPGPLSLPSWRPSAGVPGKALSAIPTST